MDETEDISPGSRPSDGSKGPNPRGEGGARIYRNFCRSLKCQRLIKEIQMSQVKEFGTSLYVGRRDHASAYGNQSSTYWGQCPVFSHPAFTQGSPQRVDAV